MKNPTLTRLVNSLVAYYAAERFIALLKSDRTGNVPSFRKFLQTESVALALVDDLGSKVVDHADIDWETVLSYMSDDIRSYLGKARNAHLLAKLQRIRLAQLSTGDLN